MIKKIIYIFSFFILIISLGYLFLPNPDFPNPPSDSLQSKEPADTEILLRRAYFTNYTRQQVLDWYQSQFKWGYWLNYPPEESSTIIRDQTRSTFLEEIVHPFRESLFVNGFEPKDPKDAVFIEGRAWRQKIIVRYVPSNVFVRILVGFLTLALAFVLMREYANGKRQG